MSQPRRAQPARRCRNRRLAAGPSASEAARERGSSRADSYFGLGKRASVSPPTDARWRPGACPRRLTRQLGQRAAHDVVERARRRALAERRPLRRILELLEIQPPWPEQQSLAA
jgi:hypothetical protein